MRLAALSLTLALCAGAAVAGTPRAPSDADLCEGAALRAAAAENTPPEVLRAIALAETGGGKGGKGRPWPWTTNVEGVGKWHESRDAAIAYIKGRHAEGARSYDIGCFQINRRWHGDAFSSLEEMFDPDANARYAAQFLKSLKHEAGSWNRAAGWYHSRTPELAAKYRRRVETILASLPAPPPEAAMIFGGGTGKAPRRIAARDAPRPEINPPAYRDPGIQTPGGVRLALARLAPAERFDMAAKDARPNPAMLRRALPLIAVLAAATNASAGATGGLLPQDQAGGGPLLSPARPLFD
jgi:hypothetical protein